MLARLVDALTLGGDDALALLVQSEAEWAAVATIPNRALLVLLDANEDEDWQQLTARAGRVATTERAEVLAGLAPGAMVVALVDSARGVAELAESPARVEALDRAVRWIVVREGEATLRDDHRPPDAAARAAFAHAEDTLRRALVRAPPAGGTPDRTTIERAGEATLAAEGHLARATDSALPLMSVGLIALTGALLMMEAAWGSPTFTATLVRMGALSGALFAEGEPGRLLTSALLHGGIVHFASNALALWFCGKVLEPVVGPARTLVVFTLAALGGSVACLLVRPEVLVLGASGGIFGMMTALFGLTFRRAGAMPAVSRARLRAILAAVLGQNALMSLMPGVSLAGHAGGALVGLALGASGLLAVGLDRPWLPPIEPARAQRLKARFRRAAAACAVALFGSLAVVLQRERPWDVEGGAPSRTFQVPGTSYVVQVPGDLMPRAEPPSGTTSGVTFGRALHDPMLVTVRTRPAAGESLDELLAQLFQRWAPQMPGADIGIRTVDGLSAATVRARTRAGGRYANWAFVDGATVAFVEVTLDPGAPPAWTAAFDAATPKSSSRAGPPLQSTSAAPP